MSERSELEINTQKIIDKYRPKIESGLQEFHNLPKQKLQRYIRMTKLLTSFEKGHILQKFMLIWIAGMFNFALKLFKHDIAFNYTLDDDSIKQVYYDACACYLKPMLQSLNRELRQEFKRNNLPFKSVKLEDLYNSKVLVHIGEGNWKSTKTKLSDILGKILNLGKLPTLLGLLTTVISTLLVVLTNFINHLVAKLATLYIVLHLLTGINKAFNIFTHWMDTITIAVYTLARKEAGDIKPLEDSCSTYIAEQVKAQIYKQEEHSLLYRWESFARLMADQIHRVNLARLEIAAAKAWRSKWILLMAFVLLLGGVSFGVWQLAKPNSNPVQKQQANQINKTNISAHQITQALSNMGNIIISEEQGHESYSVQTQATLPGTDLKIPKTEGTIVVNYDYKVTSQLHLEKLTEDDVQVEQNRIIISLPKLTDDIQVSNDQPEATGWLSIKSNLREEVVKLTGSNTSYIDILTQDAKKKLEDKGQLETLNKKSELQAIDQIQKIVQQLEQDNDLQVTVLFY